MRYFMKKRSGIFLAVILLLTGSAKFASGIGQTTSTPTHFISVWAGENGQDHMNLLVVSALLNEQPVVADDEIGIFSGSKCVGAAKLTTAIDPANYTTFVNIPVSRDDGGGNGFTVGDTIIFKMWSHTAQQEVEVTSAIYRNDQPTWLTTGKFSSGATSVVELAYLTGVSQTINFIKGNNLFSTYLVPFNADISIVFKSLVDAGVLSKIQDESGNTLSYSNRTKTWTDNIGSIKQTEGYLVSVLSNCQLKVNGNLIELPLAIPLKSGWNIISFPKTEAADAMQIIQPLIDQGKLIKVQDESGNSIEIAKKSKAWINSIGNFRPGEAYKIDVTADAVLTIQ